MYLIEYMFYAFDKILQSIYIIFNPSSICFPSKFYKYYDYIKIVQLIEKTEESITVG